MVWVGVPTKWREQKSKSTYILKLCRNSIIPKHPLVITATAVAAARHLPPPQPQSLRGLIIVVVLILIVIVIVTAVTIVFPPSSVIF
jgi:prepilin signal peptidase PulO-like enzyme (type II secretory pathway)